MLLHQPWQHEPNVSIKYPKQYLLQDIMKYLSVTLNVRTQDNRIRGRYTAEQLASHLDKFIDIFVLCPTCLHARVPLLIHNGSLARSCSGCGAVTVIPPHKVTTFILNQLVLNQQTKAKTRAQQKSAQVVDDENFFISSMQDNPLTKNMF
eukprot:TRINITY_DN4207_c0_g1_i8.p1 TRINITY_DN4207_c0_g1~~TRINITY_DN4207_c0_g1_i8.p1  ORF type:complete len:150 (+),score=5.68 TRINITY_DN4207_c0_g1_i8:818-1267(+)